MITGMGLCAILLICVTIGCEIRVKWYENRLIQLHQAFANEKIKLLQKLDEANWKLKVIKQCLRQQKEAEIKVKK